MLFGSFMPGWNYRVLWEGIPIRWLIRSIKSMDHLSERTPWDGWERPQISNNVLGNSDGDFIPVACGPLLGSLCRESQRNSRAWTWSLQSRVRLCRPLWLAGHTFPVSFPDNWKESSGTSPPLQNSKTVPLPLGQHNIWRCEAVRSCLAL